MTNGGSSSGSPAMTNVAPWVEHLARVGYVAKALLYITVGLIAAGAGMGHGGRAVDTQGALRAVHGATFGRVALIVVAAGLIGYAVWRPARDPGRAQTRPDTGPRWHSAFRLGRCWYGSRRSE